MTAKEFVKECYPKARVEGYTKNDGERYYLCFSEFRGMRLSEGKSESNAWVNAKKSINKFFT